MLLYPDGTEIKTLKESSENFIFYKYREECRKPYHRLLFLLCPTLDFSVCKLEQCLCDAEEIKLGDENLHEKAPARRKRKRRNHYTFPGWR